MPFQKGHTINLGRKESIATRLKKSQARSGMKFTNEHRKNLSESHKGYVMPESQKIKIGLASIGRNVWPRTEEHRAKTSASYTGWNDGEKSHLWRGGKTEESKLIRSGRKYRLWRTAVFKRDNYTCQICYKHGGKLNADHIKSFAQFPKLRFKINNGRTLCVDCHKKTDTYGRNSWLGIV